MIDKFKYEMICNRCFLSTLLIASSLHIFSAYASLLLRFYCTLLPHHLFLHEIYNICNMICMIDKKFMLEVVVGFCTFITIELTFGCCSCDQFHENMQHLHFYIWELTLRIPTVAGHMD